jgi:hypothetical protein
MFVFVKLRDNSVSFCGSLLEYSLFLTNALSNSHKKKDNIADFKFVKVIYTLGNQVL